MASSEKAEAYIKATNSEEALLKGIDIGLELMRSSFAEMTRDAVDEVVNDAELEALVDRLYANFRKRLPELMPAVTTAIRTAVADTMTDEQVDDLLSIIEKYPWFIERYTALTTAFLQLQKTIGEEKFGPVIEQELQRIIDHSKGS